MAKARILRVLEYEVESDSPMEALAAHLNKRTVKGSFRTYHAPGGTLIIREALLGEWPYISDETETKAKSENPNG